MARSLDSSMVVLRDPQATLDFVGDFLASSVGCAVIAADVDGLITVWDEGARLIYGYPAEDVVGRLRMTDLYVRDSDSPDLDALLFVETGGSSTGSVVGVRRSGEQFPAHVIATRLSGRKRHRGGFLLIVEDATDDVCRADELRQPQGYNDAEAQLAALVRSSHDAIVTRTLDGVITSWNPGADRLYGYTGSEIIGHRMDILIPAAAQDAEMQLLRRIGLGERVDPYETGRIHKDGRQVAVSVSASPITDSTGRVVGVATMSRDLSDRQLAEATFRGVLDMAPDAILGVNVQGSIVLLNAQCEQMFRYSRDELAGQSVDILVPDRARAAHADHRAHYYQDPATRPMGAGMELTAVRSDGTEFPAEISLSALDTAGGKLIIAAIRDVSDRQRIERTLREQNVALERASRAKDNFLASMSHELRTPLNAIIGFTGTLLMGLPGPLTADQDYQLRLVQGSGKHLLSIINDLLDLAKIESGQVQITPEPVDCVRVVLEVVQSLRPMAEGRLLTLDVDAPDRPVIVTSDRRAVGQILINLVNNAIKFTQQGGVRVTLTPSAAGGPVRIAVSDTGPGIPDEHRELIFRAFERSSATAKANDEGTGLGLHISQRLAELLRAELSVSSSVGEGSTFTLALAGR